MAVRQNAYFNTVVIEIIFGSEMNLFQCRQSLRLLVTCLKCK